MTFVWIFGLIAILYNPIIPVYLYKKEIWMVVNIITAGIFFIKKDFFPKKLLIQFAMPNKMRYPLCFFFPARRGRGRRASGNQNGAGTPTYGLATHMRRPVGGGWRTRWRRRQWRLSPQTRRRRRRRRRRR